MKRVLFIAGLLSSLASAAQPQKTVAFRFIDSLFRGERCRFEVTEFDFPADIQGILLRFNNGLAANKEWFEQYSRNAPAGQPLPYDERFGISRDEYARIRNMDKMRPALKIVDTQQVAVLRQDGKITFKGEGDARILDYLEFLPASMQLVFAGDTIPFVPVINSPALTAYSLSDGYTWRLEKADLSKSLEASQLTARVIEIDLGIREPGGQVLLRIQYQDMEGGVSKANLDLAGYIH